MKKNIPINAGYLASALGLMMTRNDTRELKFTKEEYEAVYEKGQYVKLEGEYRLGEEAPEYLVFTLYSREEYLKEMN